MFVEIDGSMVNPEHVQFIGKHDEDPEKECVLVFVSGFRRVVEGDPCTIAAKLAAGRAAAEKKQETTVVIASDVYETMVAANE
jgi:hypothetical protein